MHIIEQEIQRLPARQREAFLMRYLGGYGRRRDRRGHGLFGRQRQDALFPCHAHTGAGPASAGSDYEQKRQRNPERRFVHACARPPTPRRELPPALSERLAAARRIALAHKKAEVTVKVPRLALAGADAAPIFEEDDTPLHRAGSWLRRLALLWALIVLAIGLVAIYQWQQQKRIDELADVDAAMLLDELPPAAYADRASTFSSSAANKPDDPPPLRRPRRRLVLIVSAGLVAAAAWVLNPLRARAAAHRPLPRPPRVPAPARGAAQARPKWDELTPVQQRILAPLQPAWESSGELHRRKWLQIAERYPKFSPAEQSGCRRA